MKRKSKCDSDILMINKNISILHVAMCRRINNKSFVCIVIQTWKRIFSSLILSCFNPVKQQYLQHQKCKKCVTIPLCCYCNTVKIQSYISAVFIILEYSTNARWLLTFLFLFLIIIIVRSSLSNLMVFFSEKQKKHCHQLNAKAAYILHFSIL